MMQTISHHICPVCKTKFSLTKKQRRNRRTPCCSPHCGQKFSWQGEKRKAQVISGKKIQLAKHYYETNKMTVSLIAKEVGMERGTIFRRAKKGGWKRFKNPYSRRYVYRKVAEKKLGRSLRPHEQVHHVDLNASNNDPKNIHVFSGAKTHTQAHKSLEQCGLEFFRRGLVVFNFSTGKYEVRVATSLVGLCEPGPASL